MFPLTASRILVASIIAAFIGLGSYVMQVEAPKTSMAISPNTATSLAGAEIVVHVVVESATPVNAFAGELQFDSTKLEVTRIDYNYSIADLWAEEPWYKNGDGTIGFAGGSTRIGGFTGSGNIITVTFRSKDAGVSTVEITRAQILKHDGLGTDTDIATPIDALFTVTAEVAPVVNESHRTTQVVVASKDKNLDLSGDGKQSLADVSVFLQYLVTGNTAGDVNGDGRVSIADMSILLETF
jgi:hypothetical protein